MGMLNEIFVSGGLINGKRIDFVAAPDEDDEVLKSWWDESKVIRDRSGRFATKTQLSLASRNYDAALKLFSTIDDRSMLASAVETLRAMGATDDIMSAIDSRHIYSPSFKSWFGDWEHNAADASKVITTSGRPKIEQEMTPEVVYHGTDSDFDSFDIDKASEGLLYGPGFYFTDSQQVAKVYSPVVKKVFLNIRNPINIDSGAFTDDDLNAINAKIESINFDELPSEWGISNPRDKAKAVRDEIGLWLGMGGAGHYALYGLLDNHFDKAGANWVLDRLGFDGITHTGTQNGYSQRVWIAFNPSQIKSVDNEGTFNKLDANMFKSQTLRHVAKQLLLKALSKDPEFEKTHPRARNGQFINKNLIIFAARNPDVADRIRATVDNPSDLEKLNNLLSHYQIAPPVAIKPSKAADRRSSTWMFTGPTQVKGTGEDGSIRAADVGKYLTDLIPDSQKIRPMDLRGDPGGAKYEAALAYNAKEAKKLAAAIADEAEFAHFVDPTSAHWYSHTFEKAMNVVEQKYPELATDPDLRNVFISSLVINSNGMSVVENFKLADEVYTYFKANGKFPVDMEFPGNTGPTMRKNYQALQALIDKTGSIKGLQVLRKRMSMNEVADLSRINDEESVDADGKKKKKKNVSTGEMISYYGHGSNMLGPKLGAFHANLSGDYDKITMDRWFTRTMSRMQGISIDPSPETVKENAAEMMGIVEGLPGDKVLGFNKAKVIEGLKETSKSGTLKITSTAGKYLAAQQREYARSRFKDKSEPNKMAHLLMKNIYGLRDAPGSGSYREFYRTAMTEASDILRRKGIDLNPADLQAVLWYNEKRLWAHLGVGNRRSAPVSYQDAAEHVFLGMHPDLTAGSSDDEDDGDEEN